MNNDANIFGQASLTGTANCVPYNPYISHIVTTGHLSVAPTTYFPLKIRQANNGFIADLYSVEYVFSDMADLCHWLKKQFKSTDD